MEYKIEKLSIFFEKIKTLTWWQRIFSWRAIRELSYDAYEEFAKLKTLSEENTQLQNQLMGLKKDYEHLSNSLATAQTNNLKSENKISLLETQLQEFNQKLRDLSNENTRLNQTEDQRREDYQKNINELNSIKKGLENERIKLREEREKEIHESYERLEKNWANHELSVEESIKAISRKYTIEYLDKEKVPFKGKPDNTIKICNEFVIFDAKSPKDKDVKNFPSYVKKQTEEVKKYIKEENVRKDIYLVIPTNTTEVIEQFSYNMADYNVFVVTIDALEPIILTLKMLETYDFVDKLSPEERDNICRVIGKFAHTAKRRIQVDQFFARQFLEINSKCETDLPKEILEKAIEYEKSEKLNPPQEKRAKQILNKELESEVQKIGKEAEAKNIAFPSDIQQSLERLPLYKEEQ